MCIKKITFCVLLGCLLVSSTWGQETPIRRVPDASALNSRFGNTPLYFIPNRGQVDDKALFYARTPGYTLWVTANGLVFDAMKQNSTNNSVRDVTGMTFLGSASTPLVIPSKFTEHRVNFLKGNAHSFWKSNIPTSKAVRYKNLYQGIDLEVYGIQKQIEYDWVVKPGADPALIKVQYDGVQGTSIDNAGNLEIRSQLGKWSHMKPVAYQIIDNVKVPVKASFCKKGAHTFGFQVGDYDKRFPLTIDPIVMAYSTFIGGSASTASTGMTVDGSGCVYLIGVTNSQDFPLVNAFKDKLSETSWGYDRDVFVTKFSASGDSLIYSTFLGGSNYDYCVDIAVDNNGNAYVLGTTQSRDFPMQNPFQAEFIEDDWGGGVPIFLSKLSASGDAVEYSTYFGGSEYDTPTGIAVDDLGCAYITGQTYSIDFPVKNAFQAELKPDNWGYYTEDAFVSKFSPSGDSLEFSTYLGGKYGDSAVAIAVDQNRSAYVFGNTYSPDFPVLNAFMDKLYTDIWDSYGDDMFVTKFSPAGDTLEYSTYLGGNYYDEGRDIAVDNNGNAYVTGVTYSTEFPVVNPIQMKGGAVDLFVTKFAATGSSLEYSTYLGGSYDDLPVSIAVDDNGSAYISGVTYSVDFPAEDAFQDHLAVGAETEVVDLFLTKLTPAGNAISFSTFFGGTNYDENVGVGLDSFGNICLAGNTISADFPLKNAFQSQLNAYSNPFVTKFYNTGISLEVTRKMEKTWLLKREYAEISFTANDSIATNTATFQLYRKTPGSDFQMVSEIPVSMLQSGRYTGYDLLPQEDIPYIYKVEALNSEGVFIGISDEITI